MSHSVTTLAAEKGLHLYTSNRLEVLASELASAVRSPLSSVLQSETIVVQSQGMAKWLKLQLAAQHGICMNVRFPFPKLFGQEIFAAAFQTTSDNFDFQSDLLTWRILGALPELIDLPEFEPLRRYLDGQEPDPRKQFQLAQRISTLFDQYVIFRPELICAWDERKDSHWQAQLWRAVTQSGLKTHPAALRARLAELDPSVAIGNLPERLSIFGISALPPFYLEIFSWLSERIPVFLFLLQPSKEYWGMIVSSREAERFLKRHGKGAAAADELHLERGNPLLASMGQLGRDFLNLVLETDLRTAEGEFIDPGQDTLLHAIQSDILQLQERGKQDVPKLTIAAEDGSLQVHSCHGPMREMEVLRDYLLRCFEEDPALAPRDILVMVPDLETYAPFVQAVFDSPESAQQDIPYSLADRAARSQSQLIETFLNLLKLPSGRLSPTSLLALLDVKAMRDKFGIAEPDLERIRQWVLETRVRWGIDASHRGRLKLPALDGNTWRQGLDRLLLGYAMAGKEQRLFDRILPYDDVEGSAADLLGRFVEFAEQIFSTVQSLEQERPFSQWHALLHEILEEFFQFTPEAEADWAALNEALGQFRRIEEEIGFHRPVSLDVVIEQLKPLLDQDRFGSGFLTGRVTFGALKPMRSLPFKIICLVGMNDGAFPRANVHLGFDLMAKDPRLGDRSTREDDRYLFLETVLSARDRLFISYSGQSIRDNSPVPPSVLVSELLEYIRQGFEGNGKDLVSDQVLFTHRLQAFSPQYFQGGRLYSYSQENCAASEHRRIRTQPRPFIESSLNEPEEEWRTVSVESLTQFFRNPARFLLRQRLGLRVRDGDAPLQEGEPFDVKDLEGYKLKEDLVIMRLRGQDETLARAITAASGRLPHGRIGECWYQNVRGEVEAFCQRLRQNGVERLLPPLDIDLALEPFRITGRLAKVTSSGPLNFRFAKIKSKDILRHWVEHLVWSAMLAQSGESILVGSDETKVFNPHPDPIGALRQLLNCYWQGLMRPLKLFPESSYAFAAAGSEVTKRQSKSSPIEKAKRAWEGTPGSSVPGERSDIYFDLCFRNTNPLDEEFEETAGVIFKPILEHIRQGL